MGSRADSNREWHVCTENDWEQCTKGVNCYSYALNRPDYYWSVPGMGFAKTSARHYIDSFNAYFKSTSLENFRNQLIHGAIDDGLIAVEEANDREGFFLAALFFADDDHDFHWYRKDENGLWSHKDGWGSVKYSDENGNPISDPRKAVNNSYTIFGGFFLVPHTGIILRQNVPLLYKE